MIKLMWQYATVAMKDCIDRYIFSNTFLEMATSSVGVLQATLSQMPGGIQSIQGRVNPVPGKLCQHIEFCDKLRLVLV